jgi:hypothetical protein
LLFLGALLFGADLLAFAAVLFLGAAFLAFVTFGFGVFLTDFLTDFFGHLHSSGVQSPGLHSHGWHSHSLLGHSFLAEALGFFVTFFTIKNIFKNNFESLFKSQIFILNVNL